jgi:hypothetical protein
MYPSAVKEANFAAASKLAAGVEPRIFFGEQRMGPVAAGTAIGAAALTLGRGAASAVGNGLSFAAELLRAASGGSTSTEQATDASAAAQKALQLQIDEMQQRIQQQLAVAGIQLTQPVDLVSNGQGGIAVAGPHPQQTAIEEVLGSDILLERDFNNLAMDYDEFVSSHGARDLPPSLTITVPPTP